MITGSSDMITESSRDHSKSDVHRLLEHLHSAVGEVLHSVGYLARLLLQSPLIAAHNEHSRRSDSGSRGEPSEQKAQLAAFIFRAVIVIHINNLLREIIFCNSPARIPNKMR